MQKIIVVTLALVAALGAGCTRRGITDIQKANAKAAIPKVPYLVNDRSEAPVVVLCNDAERSAKLGSAHVPKGTKCKIVDNKEMDRTRGGTMYKVQAVTGETGWVPHFCVEFRHK